MKKAWIYILIIAIAIAIILFAIFNFKIKNNSNNGYTVQKAKANTNIDNSSYKNNTNNIESTNNVNNSSISDNIKEDTSKNEEEISSFSTKILNPDSERQNNISITCSTLNETEIAPGATFSFCDTIGKSTSDKGYQEADIIVDGKKKQGLGGGNCQVSTTLYNAVLAIPELQVIERHEHSGYVPYIEEGKDAAVSYGSHDFKFINNTDSTIKILAQNTPEEITIRLIKIS